jgi:hypothetical protein
MAIGLQQGRDFSSETILDFVGINTRLHCPNAQHQEAEKSGFPKYHRDLLKHEAIRWQKFVAFFFKQFKTRLLLKAGSNGIAGEFLVARRDCISEFALAKQSLSVCANKLQLANQTGSLFLAVVGISMRAPFATKWSRTKIIAKFCQTPIDSESF